MFIPFTPPAHIPSPFGPTGHGSVIDPTRHERDVLGRDVFSTTTVTGRTTTEVRDYLGNVIERRSSLFD
jgi:hypothetical protein